MKLVPIRKRTASTCLRVLWFVVMGFAILLSGPSAADRPLHILLTNDDGYDAPGITTLHKALLDAGYKVTVVAPLNQQSGSSMRVTIGSIVVEKVSNDFWTVAGTPADTVAFALNKTLHDDPPDIVVSGINFGQNLGSNTNLSGTVGAAIMATQNAVPALAVSVGIDLAERSATPVRFPSTMAAFPAAAELTIHILRQLEDSRSTGQALLPPHKVVNVNYPALPAAKIKGVRMAEVATVGGFVARFVENSDAGRIDVELEPDAALDNSVSNPDTALFANGYITVSVLDGRLGAGQTDTVDMTGRLKKILEPIPEAPTQRTP